MKLGGFGAVDAISGLQNRFEKTKAVTADKVSESPTIVSSPKKQVTSTKASKSFSGVLGEIVDKAESNSQTETVTPTEPNALALVGLLQTQQPSTVRNLNIESEIEEVSIGEKLLIPENVIAKPPQIQLESSSIDENISSIAEVLTEAADTGLSMRHTAMRDFLEKMKTEFGIEPKAIVNAFAKLDQTTLMAPPDETATVVLSQLNLKPEEMPKAERFYREMLNQTGESALNETLVGVGAGVALNILSEQDVAMEKLQKSITGLNDAFARRSETPTNVAPSSIDSSSSIKPDAAVTSQTPIAMVASTPTPVLTPASAPMSASASAPASPASTMPVVDAGPMSDEDSDDNFDNKNKTESKKEFESKFASLGAALSAATGKLAGDASGGDKNSGSKQESKSQESTQSKSNAFESIESALAFSGAEQLNMGGERAAVPLAAGSATAASLAATLASQQGDGTSTNAQELVRHAQILVKNGGGEMKMQLKPEGVGDVTLKVAVKDGQVQIQMMTETDSAKKILESNLDDLKTSLAQHKLHVDAVKIEVGSEMAKQRFEQGQQDASREQSRQIANDFMNQFRQDREGFRSGFADFSGSRRYQQPNRNPLPEVEQVPAAKTSKSSSDRRLNLVA